MESQKLWGLTESLREKLMGLWGWKESQNLWGRTVAEAMGSDGVPEAVGSDRVPEALGSDGVTDACEVGQSHRNCGV